jgi:tetratricopeptide (TPR) repeat protein
MRTFAALAIYVSLASATYGADWAVTHDQGRKAFIEHDFRSAADWLRQSWAAAQTDAERAVSANDLGAALHELGRDREAQQWLQQSLEIGKFANAATSETLAATDRNLGDYQQAGDVLRAALAERTNEGNGRARLLIALGDLLREQGKVTESRRLIEEALRIPGIAWRREFDARAALADVERNAGAWQASQADWNTAAAIARQHAAPVLEALALRGLGETWLDLGNNARAEPLLRNALVVFGNNRELGANAIAAAETDLAQLYLNEDKTALAEESMRRAIQTDERWLGDDHPQVAFLLEMLAETLAQSRRLDLARNYFARAARIMAARFGEKSAAAAAVEASWGIVEQRFGDPGQAVALYEKALAALPADPDQEPLRLTLMERYAEVLKTTHRNQEARAVLAQVKSFREP